MKQITCYLDFISPYAYLAFEQYADDKAFNAHMTAQHTVECNTELASLVEGRGSVLSWLEPC